jgi:hypothetical protein
VEEDKREGVCTEVSKRVCQGQEASKLQYCYIYFKAPDDGYSIAETCSPVNVISSVVLTHVYPATSVVRQFFFDYISFLLSTIIPPQLHPMWSLFVKHS